MKQPKPVLLLLMLVLLLLLAVDGRCQLAPPTNTVKKRHGESATFTWSYVANPAFALQYFSIKSTSDLSVTPREVKQVPAAQRQATLDVQFDPQNNKTVYYVITGISDGPLGHVESYNSNTVAASRIGPPP